MKKQGPTHHSSFSKSLVALKIEKHYSKIWTGSGYCQKSSQGKTNVLSRYRVHLPLHTQWKWSSKIGDLKNFEPSSRSFSRSCTPSSELPAVWQIASLSVHSSGLELGLCLGVWVWGGQTNGQFSAGPPSRTIGIDYFCPQSSFSKLGSFHFWKTY